MRTMICDKCKKGCTECYTVETVIKVGVKSTYRIFFLCKECKKWLLHELGKKEKWEEKK